MSAQDTIYFDKSWIVTDKDNAEFYRIDKPENNKWLRTDFYTRNDQVQMKGYLLSREPDIKTGYFEWFFPNGKLMHKGYYNNNNAIDKHYWYHDNGNLEAIENYKDGLLDGPCKVYYESGVLSTETSYSAGVQNGFTKIYREDGSLQSQGNIINGNRNGEWTFFDSTEKEVEYKSYQPEFQIAEAKLYLKMPNSLWAFDSKNPAKALTEYIFKRQFIKDKYGRQIVPSIIVITEDASVFAQDVLAYSYYKQDLFEDTNLEIDKRSVPGDIEYPLSCNNSIILKSHYTKDNITHLLYQVFIINSDNTGIDIYMDMTLDIAEEYEHEFLDAIRSIRKS